MRAARCVRVLHGVFIEFSRITPCKFCMDFAGN